MFNLAVAFRFLKEGKSQTALILIGITLGIAVQVFLNALIVDLQRSLVEDTVGRSPHITATMADAQPLPAYVPDDGRPALSRIVTNEGNVKPIRNWEPVAAQLAKLGAFKVVNPVAQGSGFIQQGGKSLPVVLRGFDLERADALYDIRRRLVAGRYEVGGNGVLIGRELADKLRTGVGASLRISVPGGASDLFPVNGVFDLKNQALNESWVVVSLNRAQILFGLDRGLTHLELQVPDAFSAASWAASLRTSFPALKWLSWQETNAQLLAALQGQGSSSYIIQLFVLLSVTLAIASVLAISVVQRSRQIGILKALGLKTRQIGRIFIIQGAVLGFVGSVVGSLAGWGLIEVFVSIQKANRAASLTSIPVKIPAVALSIAIATLAGTLAAFVPARRAARLNPIEVIRNG
jgi:lipoprotein-releasing system permease protein